MEYQSLMDSLKNVEPETFPFDVTSVAMNSIMIYEQNENKKKALLSWGGLFIVLISISSLSIPYVPKVLALFYSNSIYTSLLVIGTGLVVFIFLLADIIQNYKNKEKLIFNKELQPINGMTV